MAVPKLTNFGPAQGSEFSITDHIPLQLKVPLGVGNPPNINVEISDRIDNTHYLITDPDPDLATAVIRIRPYHHILLNVPVTPQNPPYVFSLPLLDVIGFHLIEIVASDAANPGEIFQHKIRVRVVYP